jgi:4-carboxymuconolactone decarboxylase
MPRIHFLTDDEMTDEQRRMRDEIASGPRGGLRGPFNAWMHRPPLLDRAQKLGAYCRFDSSLEPRLSELAILVTARHWSAQFEWYAHGPLAEKAGIDPRNVEAIRTRQEPTFDKEDEAIVYRFAKELYDSTTVSQATYDEAVRILGEGRVVDLVGVLGYYGLVSMTLNVFDMPLPDGVAPPLS